MPRKRKRISESEKTTPLKKTRISEPQTPKTPKTPGSAKKKKRNLREERERKRWYVKRRRLNDIRQKVAKSIERALVEAPKVPPIWHLFTERDSMGTPRAPLQQVLRTLKISNYVKNTHFLHDNYMLSLTKFTTLFSIERDEPEKGLFLKFWPIYDRKLATVYVDNLPEGCCEEKLMRLASCYGTVVSLSIAKKGPRMIRPRHISKKKPPGHPAHRHIHRIPPKKKPLMNIGSRPRSYGFIRFVDQDSATDMIREFRVNDPSIPYQKHQENQGKLMGEGADESMEFVPGDPENLEAPLIPQEFPRRRPFVELYMTKLLQEIRYLKRRRKRRPWPMYLRLKRLERRYSELEIREFGCLRKAGLVQAKRKVKKSTRIRIAQALPPTSAEPSTSGRPATPPPSPNEEKNDGEGPPEPLNITPHKHHRKNQKKKKRRRSSKKKLTEKVVNGELIISKKRRRRRKKMSRKLAKYIPGGQVRRYFQNIQVISLGKYSELKEEYLKLVETEKEKAREEDLAPPPEI